MKARSGAVWDELFRYEEEFGLCSVIMDVFAFLAGASCNCDTTELRLGTRIISTRWADVWFDDRVQGKDTAGLDVGVRLSSHQGGAMD